MNNKMRITRALFREMKKMADSNGKIDDWAPDALASWVLPGVLRALRPAKRRKVAVKGAGQVRAPRRANTKRRTTP